MVGGGLRCGGGGVDLVKRDMSEAGTLGLKMCDNKWWKKVRSNDLRLSEE